MKYNLTIVEYGDYRNGWLDVVEDEHCNQYTVRSHNLYKQVRSNLYCADERHLTLKETT